MTPEEVNFVFRWMLPISVGFLLLLCGFAIDFFILRHERKRQR
jgi:hypothetical protein